MSIGTRIKLRRKELGFSADEVANRLGKNRATIYRYESDEIENLPLTILEPLAKVLQTTPAFLMGWNHTSVNSSNSFSSAIKDTNLIKAIAELNIKNSELSKEDINNILQFIEFLRSKRKENSITILNAAHEIEGSSDESRQHDEELMDDDTIWS